jgi:hypothetical protein
MTCVTIRFRAAQVREESLALLLYSRRLLMVLRGTRRAIESNPSRFGPDAVPGCQPVLSALETPVF